MFIFIFNNLRVLVRFLFYGGEACGWRWEVTYSENPMGFLRNTNTSVRLAFVFLRTTNTSVRLAFSCLRSLNVTFQILFLVLFHKGGFSLNEWLENGL